MMREEDHATIRTQTPPAKSTSRHMLLLMTAVALSCNFASQGSAQGKAPAGPKDNVLASLSLKDGSIVQFNETNPGEIVVSALTPMGPGSAAGAINGVSPVSLGRLDAVGKFKALAPGAAVPAALAQAQARVTAAMRRSVAADPKKAATRAPASAASVASVAPTLDGGTFQSSYCPSGGYTFNFCWLYRTGNGYVQRSASYMQSTVNAYRGNIGHQLQYESCFLWSCNWYTNISWTVPQGYTQWIWVSGSSMTRKASTYDAVGDGYHWAVFGY